MRIETPDGVVGDGLLFGEFPADKVVEFSLEIGRTATAVSAVLLKSPCTLDDCDQATQSFIGPDGRLYMVQATRWNFVGLESKAKAEIGGEDQEEEDGPQGELLEEEERGEEDGEPEDQGDSGGEAEAGVGGEVVGGFDGEAYEGQAVPADARPRRASSASKRRKRKRRR